MNNRPKTDEKIHVGSNVKVTLRDGTIWIGTVQFIGDGGAEGTLIRISGHAWFASSHFDKIEVLED